jgi:transposase InsO family protein
MTAQLVTDALVMAIWRRGKPDALLHHSDRGSQYTSEQFQQLIRRSSLKKAAATIARSLGCRLAFSTSASDKTNHRNAFDY